MKGNISDMIIGMVLIFIIAISVLISWFLVDEFQQVNELNVVELANTKIAIENFNYGFIPIVIIGIFMSIVILAALIPTHPIFLPLAMILLAVDVLLAAMLTNFYTEIATETILSTAATEFDVMTQIMFSLPIWVTIGGAIIIIATYAKSRGADYSA